VVDWANGKPEDAAQQQALQPLLEAGRRLGISFVGRVGVKQGEGPAVAAARTAGLSAVLLRNASGETFDLPAILQFPRDKVAGETVSTLFSTSGNVWPGVNLENSGRRQCPRRRHGRTPG